MADTKIVPAVVIGAGLNGLGVVRSLAKGGMPILLLDSNLEQPTARTRLAERIKVASIAGTDSAGRDILDELLTLADRFKEPPVLFLTQEETVSYVSMHRDRLQGRYRFSMPPHQTMVDLLDKVRFQALAEGLGFPVPRSHTLSSLADLPAAEGLTYPCIMKPTTKNQVWGRHFPKAYNFEDFAALERQYTEISRIAPDVIVQEWIEGDDSDVYFCLVYRTAGGKNVSSFVGRKIRQWPPRIGGTASCMPAPEHRDELEAMTDRFFQLVGFVGLGSMEYKRDTRSGRFVMVEPTVGRTDYQEEVATLNGANIVLACYREEIGGVESQRNGSPSGPQVIWRDPFGYGNARAKRPDYEEPPEAAGLKSVDAYWRWYDPGPWLAVKKQAIQRRLSRRES